MLRGAFIGFGNVAAKGHLPGWLSVKDVQIVPATDAVAAQGRALAAGGIAGAVGGYGLQYWTMGVDYPVDIGGRPLNSIPAFMPVTFETTILVAVIAAVLGMLALNGLPMPYHPVFNVPAFTRASQDKFFLLIEARDRLFDYDRTRAFLTGLSPREVSDVPH